MEEYRIIDGDGDQSRSEEPCGDRGMPCGDRKSAGASGVDVGEPGQPQRAPVSLQGRSEATDIGLVPAA